MKKPKRTLEVGGRSTLPALRVAAAALLCSLVALAALAGRGADAPADDSEPVVTVFRPLLDDQGNAMPPDPAATPADPGARTNAGLYATTAQAAALTQAFGERLVPVVVGCCNPAAVYAAVSAARAVQTAAQLPLDAPFLVYGPDARLRAATADSLAAGGARRVWVVVD